MRRFRTWFLERFLPAWAKDSVYQENKALMEELTKRDQEICELNAYIDGMERAIRMSRDRSATLRRQHIIVQMEEAHHEHLERTE